MTPAPELVDRVTVARRLTISPRTVTDLVARKEIEVVRVGRLLRFSPAAIDAYIARQTTPVPPLSPPAAPATRPPLPAVRRKRFSR